MTKHTHNKVDNSYTEHVQKLITTNTYVQGSESSYTKREQSPNKKVFDDTIIHMPNGMSNMYNLQCGHTNTKKYVYHLHQRKMRRAYRLAQYVYTNFREAVQKLDKALVSYDKVGKNKDWTNKVYAINALICTKTIHFVYSYKAFICTICEQSLEYGKGHSKDCIYHGTKEVRGKTIDKTCTITVQKDTLLSCDGYYTETKQNNAIKFSYGVLDIVPACDNSPITTREDYKNSNSDWINPNNGSFENQDIDYSKPSKNVDITSNKELVAVFQEYENILKSKIG